MKIDWRKTSHLAAAIMSTVVPGVDRVEQLAWDVKDMHGSEKQSAVVELVRQSLAAGTNITGQAIAEDSDVVKATRGVIDAYVALQQIVAHKAQGITPAT